jgi:hypothetical protein
MSFTTFFRSVCFGGVDTVATPKVSDMREVPGPRLGAMRER